MTAVLDDSPLVLDESERLPTPETHHLLHPDLATRRLSVHVVGLGGTGSQVLTGLARLDSAMRALGHPGGLFVHAMDPDVVSQSNVGRQLFSPADVGRAKADVLIHRLNLYFGLDWEASAVRYQTVCGAGPVDDGADILITCVDTIRDRRAIADAVRLPGPRPTYWLDLGNSRESGQAVLTEPECGRTIDVIGAQQYCTCSDCRRGIADSFARLDIPHKPACRRLPTIAEALPDVFDASIDAAAVAALDRETGPSCSLADALGEQDLFINQAVATVGLQLLWQLLRYGAVDTYGSYVNLRPYRVLPAYLPDPATMEESNG